MVCHVCWHWLDVPERVQYKLGVTVRRCQQHKTPQYTWFIVLRQPRTSPVVSDYALPVVTNFLCRVTNAAHLIVGPSLSLDQWLGNRCRLTSVIRRVVTSRSDVYWKHSCSLSTSVSSALEVFYDDALYKSTLSIYLYILGASAVMGQRRSPRGHYRGPDLRDKIKGGLKFGFGTGIVLSSHHVIGHCNLRSPLWSRGGGTQARNTNIWSRRHKLLCKWSKWSCRWQN